MTEFVCGAAPVLDVAVDEPAPYLVLVQGPPGVGKTTLIKCLVKQFTRQSVPVPTGPITVVSGKKRRITLLECPQDLCSMIDMAKVADLVLLLIDGEFGFEMETFEFLMLLQQHGMPKVMGVLTHLDGFKDNKKLKNVKKTLKHRRVTLAKLENTVYAYPGNPFQGKHSSASSGCEFRAFVRRSFGSSHWLRVLSKVVLRIFVLQHQRLWHLRAQCTTVATGVVLCFSSGLLCMQLCNALFTRILCRSSRKPSTPGSNEIRLAVISTMVCLACCVYICRKMLCSMCRFETEVARGAKLFFLSGIRHGRYLKREILNLARFIAVSKAKPLNWRLNHPYLIADRFEVRRHLQLSLNGPSCTQGSMRITQFVHCVHVIHGNLRSILGFFPYRFKNTTAY
jgi:GTPase SAR1 family protein